jgi:hypothetical protein
VRGDVSRCSVGTIGNDGELGRSTDQAGLSHPPNAAAPLHSAECWLRAGSLFFASRDRALAWVLGRRWVRACPRTPHRILVPRGCGIVEVVRPARCGDDPRGKPVHSASHRGRVRRVDKGRWDRLERVTCPPARVGPRGWPDGPSQPSFWRSRALRGLGVCGVLVLCCGANRESLRRSLVVNTVRAGRNAGSLDR